MARHFGSSARTPSVRARWRVGDEGVSPTGVAAIRMRQGAGDVDTRRAMLLHGDAAEMVVLEMAETGTFAVDQWITLVRPSQASSAAWAGTTDWPHARRRDLLEQFTQQRR